MEINRQQKGVFVIKASIMNKGFSFLFILTILGEEAVAFTSIFDIGNSLLKLTLPYSVAVTFCTENDESGTDTALLVRKLVLSFPSWALLIGITINIIGVSYPTIYTNILMLLSSLYSKMNFNVFLG